jgi:hypothetical protein
VAVEEAAAGLTSTERNLRRVGPAALLLALAIMQFVLVFTSGVSRWRVGGMGMYSEAHPNAREVVFSKGDKVIFGHTIESACTDGKDLRREAATHPFDRNLRTFASNCLGEDLTGWTARVVAPAVDVESLELSREVVREVRW